MRRRPILFAVLFVVRMEDTREDCRRVCMKFRKARDAWGGRENS